MKFMPFIPSMFTANVCWDAKSTNIVDIVLVLHFIKIKAAEIFSLM